MKKLFQNTAFSFGFWNLGLMFVILNILPSDTHPTAAQFNNFITDRGFPFLMYREGLSSNYTTYIFWGGLIANILIDLICSFAVGLAVKFIWSKTALRQVP